MTAIGVGFLIVAALLALTARTSELPPWMEVLGGLAVLAGILLTGAGLLVWLWQVMP